MDSNYIYFVYLESNGREVAMDARSQLLKTAFMDSRSARWIKKVKEEEGFTFIMFKSGQGRFQQLHLPRR